MKTIQNFQLKSEDHKTVLNRRKTAKDWFDILLLAAIGSAFVFPSVLAFNSGFSNGKAFAFIAAVLFALVALMSLSRALIHLLQPTKNLVVVDYSTNSLQYRKTMRRTERINLNDIRTFGAEKHKEFISIDGTPTIREHGSVMVKLKDGLEQTLFVVNTKRIFKSSDVDIGSEILEVAEEISKELNRLIRKQNT